MLSLWFLVALYATIPFVEFLSPYELGSRHANAVYSPPQRVHLFQEGRFVGPFVYGQFLTVNLENLKREYREDRSRLYRLEFFAHGRPSGCGAYGRWTGNSSALERGARCSWSGPAGSAGTSSRRSCKARGT